MDLSAVIFVALAVAWAVYLVPKALKHHDEVARSRSVERFSSTMRSLARRDPAPASTSGRAVVTPGRPASGSQVTVKPRAGAVGTVGVDVAAGAVELSPAQRRARHQAARLAAKRRRRVLGTLMLAVVVAVGSAALGLVSWWVTAAPGSLVVMWLVACRAMVRGERAGSSVAAPVATVETVETEDAAADDFPSSYDVMRTEEGFDEVGPAATTASIDAAEAEAAGLWAPRPITLPTYLGKDQAPMRQYVLTKDDSGVWSAGHDTSDSLLAQDVRDAEGDDDAARDRDRAVGS